MKTALILLWSGLSMLSLEAQSVSYQWSYIWGSADTDPGPVIVSDAIGSVYTAGSFQGPVDFDPGPGEAMYQPTPFTRESYISKFDPDGHFMWVAILRTTATIAIKDIVTDKHNFLVLTGDFVGTVDFDPGPGTFNLSSTGFATETFVLKLTLDGGFVWANTTSGTGQKYGSEITMDENGSIYCAGIFTGTGDFDTGPGVEQFTAQSFVDGFISKFDSNGQFLWSLHHAGSFQVGIYGIVTDQDGNVYIGGAFDDIRDFDPGPDSLILTASGGWDWFLQKFDANGQFLWVKILANGADNWIFDLTTDSSDNLLATGYYSGTLDFDPSPGEAIHTAVLHDIYVSKFNTQGELQWVSVFEGTSFDRGNAISTDRNGNIYTVGFFGEEVDFVPGPGQNVLSSTGNMDTDDGFLAVLSSDGQFVFAANIGGIENDLCTDVAIDKEQNILLSGFFSGNAAFYPDSDAPDSLASHGLTDAFLVKWQQCLPTFQTLDTTSCNQVFVSPSGQYQWVSNGTYQDTLINYAGCDSVLTIHLTFATLDTGIDVNLELDILTAIEENATFQWVDCADGYTWIPGETSRMFAPQNDGQYAVILDNGSCRDTSACWDWVVATTKNVLTNDMVRIFPNPVFTTLHVVLNTFPGSTWIKVLNSNGQMIISDRMETLTSSIDLTDQQAGVYIVQIQTQSAIRNEKVIKF